MAKHSITFLQSAQEVLRSDVTFFVQRDGEKLGELKISKGTIDWKPKNKQRSIKWSWDKFAEMMESK